LRRAYGVRTLTTGTIYHPGAGLPRAGTIYAGGCARVGTRPAPTTYSLTDAGRDILIAWLRRELSTIDRPAEFRIALAEAHNLERGDVLQSLRSRRVALDEEHIAYRDGLIDARRDGVPEQVLVEYERQEALLEAELRWLDALIARLEAEDLPWGPTAFPNSDRYRARRKAAQQ
jgi:hypothetical protein